ncbi:MAG: hypothetical protein AMXMBFR82_35780 [Candidatus Hydrogenedentota bacterium]
MKRAQTLPAFTPEEVERVHSLLAIKVSYMMGRKMEEGDWADVYCRAKGISDKGWSNLNIDVMHDLLGVEHKMLCCRSKTNLDEACGTTLMHPAATRSIRIPSTRNPNEAMRDILRQYADLISQRRERVREQATSSGEPDMRTGWLLWQESLRQFLYFEEEMLPPDPDDFRAKWVESGGGNRKKSKNLWIYEKETGKKRYSVTTSAGAKIQPYFDVPPPDDPNLYLFTVIGEVIDAGLVRVWLTESTARELESFLGSLDSDLLSSKIFEAAEAMRVLDDLGEAETESGVPVFISVEAYEALHSTIDAVNDDHLFQLLVRYLRHQSQQ